MTAAGDAVREGPPVENSTVRARRLTAPLRAFLWMLGAALSFALMSTLARDLSRELHPFVIAFFRVLFALAFALSGLLKGGFGVLRTRRHGLYLWRGMVGTVIVLSLFTAVSYLPVDEVTALHGN